MKNSKEKKVAKKPSKAKKAGIIAAIVIVSILVAAIVGGIVYMNRGPEVHYPAWVHEEFLKRDNNEMEDGANVRIMSYNVLVDLWGGKERPCITDAKPVAVRCEQLKNILDYYSPDVVALQEFCEAWHLNADRYIEKDYTVIFDNPLEYTSMAYNHNKVNLIKSEKILYSQGNSKTMRYIAWALFEKKDTKEQFIVSNTHLDFGSNKAMQDIQVVELMDKLKELKAEYKVPIFSLGDYNAVEKPIPDEAFLGIDIYEQFAKESTLIDAKYIEGINHHDELQEWSFPTWDHIFVTDDVEVKSYDVLSNNYYKSISDHFPIFVDAAI